MRRPLHSWRCALQWRGCRSVDGQVVLHVTAHLLVHMTRRPHSWGCAQLWRACRSGHEDQHAARTCKLVAGPSPLHCLLACRTAPALSQAGMTV